MKQKRKKSPTWKKIAYLKSQNNGERMKKWVCISEEKRLKTKQIYQVKIQCDNNHVHSRRTVMNCKKDK